MSAIQVFSLQADGPLRPAPAIRPAGLNVREGSEPTRQRRPTPDDWPVHALVTVVLARRGTIGHQSLVYQRIRAPVVIKADHCAW